jgi:hypothetical protein
LQGSVNVRGTKAETVSDRARGGQKPEASNGLKAHFRGPRADCRVKAPAWTSMRGGTSLEFQK